MEKVRGRHLRLVQPTYTRLDTCENMLPVSNSMAHGVLHIGLLAENCRA